MENREIKTIKLSNAEVDITTYLTWGESEEIQAVLMSGADVDNTGLKGFDAGAILKAKYKAMEICIKEIREGEEKKQYSKEWASNLMVDDGNKLYSAIDELSKKKL